MINAFDKLKGCLQTEIMSKDGQKMILFHDGPLERHDLEVFEEYTAKEISYILQHECGFKSHNLGSA